MQACETVGTSLRTDDESQNVYEEGQKSDPYRREVAIVSADEPPHMSWSGQGAGHPDIANKDFEPRESIVGATQGSTEEPSELKESTIPEQDRTNCKTGHEPGRILISNQMTLSSALRDLQAVTNRSIKPEKERLAITEPQLRE